MGSLSKAGQYPYMHVCADKQDEVSTCFASEQLFVVEAFTVLCT
jgi:hypothetical protein